ncbi:GGDEF domain-containing protein [Magnetospirillum fulvum]|uniref:diguanylate cyclase n=1 Tax=Magnetospirillum fulvum TaxID=1082 RepID=A0A1H6GNL2_MAGFU|nr:GGDEF domain-containing protein [Magnetospirillum fulvum]SEH24866.1 diguanylate cyclase (GGDEF) domain-containing protein [Magnetospirillum fulvum]
MLDVRTLLVPLVLAAIFSAGALYLVNRDNLPVPGVARWAICNATGAVGMILSAMRDVLPDFLGIVASNTLIVVALAFLLSGFHQFLGKKTNFVFYAALVVVVAVLLAYFLYITPSIAARVMVMSTAASLLCGASAWVLLRPGPSPVLVRRLCGSVNLGMAIFYLVRTYVASGETITDFFSGATFVVGVHVFGFIHLLVNTFTQLILISERLNADLKRQANLDPLTGTLNRRALALVAGKAMARAERSAQPLTVLLFDLDYFKRANDTFGHAFGDALLCRFSTLVLASLRAEDSFCRYGGEEFVALLPDTDVAPALAVAERLRQAYAEDETARGVEGTVSVGLARFVRGDTLDSLMRRADLALYQAKEGGRDRCIFAEDDGGIAIVPAREVVSPA